MKLWILETIAGLVATILMGAAAFLFGGLVTQDTEGANAACAIAAALATAWGLLLVFNYVGGFVVAWGLQ